MAKTTTKKAESAAVKTEETKTVKTETATKKPAAKKAAAKTTAKKPAAKKTTKTAAAKAPAMKLYVEYQGNQVSLEDIVAAVAAQVGKAKTVEVYVKPEDGAAYYVAGDANGKVEF